MKRAAFNLIELIFVIIILGILSSVVIVKMGDMAKLAKEAQLTSFVGTLNRSVGPAIWFKSIENGRGGSITFADYNADLDKYIDFIPNYTLTPTLINCNTMGNGIFVSYTFGKNYEVHCRDGNKTSSPDFRLYNQTDDVYIE
ncbi:type II secretion system protein [Sulfurimonas sp.]|jgi:prepilin-type N-terminal cleavage/methylation domain-containing protein|uniref:type II secretion system protein n=1 Tax=Sulfurimonas sp. TaxID=2022749 RepID=UPI002A365C21|nr:type II secretion system protein [Sulfurimonas sp.]MDY0123328.1 type II secretion system protein [Sulfurimonas sp.]